MIIDKYVVVKPNNHSLYHYLNLGYEAKCKKELTVKISDLTLSSTVRVNCKCNFCGNIKNIRYQDYIKCINKNGFYACEKCKIKKTKITKKIRYNNENYNNKNKIKETLKKLYNCEYPLQNLKIRRKKEDTCFKKYGNKIASKSNMVKNKISKSHIKIFKDDNKKLSILNKRRATCLKRYGVDNFAKTEKYKILSEKTCIEKYGVSHNGSVPEFILKRRLSRIKNSRVIRRDFYLYKREVCNITRKCLKILFKEWSGYDYYDNEYIKDNFNLFYLDRSYPSVDHKISIYYGFLNNIPTTVIGDIKNLCITKRGLNSSKRDRNYNVFLEDFNSSGTA